MLELFFWFTEECIEQKIQLSFCQAQKEFLSDFLSGWIIMTLNVFALNGKILGLFDTVHLWSRMQLIFNPLTSDLMQPNVPMESNCLLLEIS
jgi:hypothetical protein